MLYEVITNPFRKRKDIRVLGKRLPGGEPVPVPAEGNDSATERDLDPLSLPDHHRLSHPVRENDHEVRDLSRHLLVYIPFPLQDEGLEALTDDVRNENLV